MKEQITENIESLFRGHMISVVLYVALFVVFGVVTVGVIKYKLLNAKWKNVLLVCFATFAPVVLLIVKGVEIAPIYRDYQEQAYIVVDEARVIIKDGSSGGLDSTNRVLINDGEKEIELKMQSEYSLDTEVEYTGQIAYLENSVYLIWYEFD